MDQAAQKELENERYQNLWYAIMEAVDKGVSKTALETLCFETGFSSKDFSKLMEERNEVN